MHDCFRLGKSVYLVTALFIAAGVFGCATTQSTAPPDPRARAAAETVKTPGPGNIQHSVDRGAGMISYYLPPSRIDFCGEPVPLEQQEVLERFDKEFTLVVYNHAQVYLWLKRKERFFPLIEERLRRLNLPEDLKYVAIAEREPSRNAPEKRKSGDIRYDFELSPDSAFQYIGDLYRNFNSWALAIAAYSCGEKSIVDASRAQGERDFYHIMLPEDAERYVFRILAMKVVLSDPTRYGYELPKSAR